MTWKCRDCGARNDDSANKCDNDECLLVRDGTEIDVTNGDPTDEKTRVIKSVTGHDLAMLYELAALIIHPEAAYSVDPIAMANAVIERNAENARGILQIVERYLTAIDDDF